MQLTLALLLLFPAVAQDEDDVRRVVVEGQMAGWKHHDVDGYLRQWAPDARLIDGRGEEPGKHDLVYDRKQIEATRRLLMHGKPEKGKSIDFANIKVKVNGNEAELRCRTTLDLGTYKTTADEIYRLRKIGKEWKVYLNRGWPIRSDVYKEVTVYNADTWKRLDQEADDLLRTDPMSFQTAFALLKARRYADAYDVTKKITASKDAGTVDWLNRGWMALYAANAEDSLASFRRALTIDEKVPVPAFVRPEKK